MPAQKLLPRTHCSSPNLWAQATLGCALGVLFSVVPLACPAGSAFSAPPRAFTGVEGRPLSCKNLSSPPVPHPTSGFGPHNGSLTTPIQSWPSRHKLPQAFAVVGPNEQTPHRNPFFSVICAYENPQTSAQPLPQSRAHGPIQSAAPLQKCRSLVSIAPATQYGSKSQCLRHQRHSQWHVDSETPPASKPESGNRRSRKIFNTVPS